MTNDEAMELRTRLEEHYQQPVMPVSEYCEAFRTWAQAAAPYLQDRHGIHPGTIGLAIAKSNLLARLIYGKQKLRTRKCPVHDGKWSGCQWEKTCECIDGINVTGWLPEPDDANADHRPLETNGRDDGAI